MYIYMYIYIVGVEMIVTDGDGNEMHCVEMDDR